MSRKSKSKNKDTKNPYAIPFSERFKDFLLEAKALISTRIFIRSALLISCVLVFAGGFKLNADYRFNKARDLAMRVSPVDSQMTFSKSQRKITFNQQYRNKDVYALPFELDSFDDISTSAKYYAVMLQGLTEQISAKMQVKFILFGTSKRGVILVKGDLPKVPMAVLIRNDKTLSSSEAITSNINDLDDMVGSDQTTNGSKEMEVGGKKIKVAKDMVSITINPSAKNIKYAKGLQFGGSKSELYKAVFANKDINQIEKRRKKILANKAKLKNTLGEYEDRLFDSNEIKDGQRMALLKADKLALDSNGNDEDVQAIKTILDEADIDSLTSTNDSGSSAVGEMNSDELKESLNKSVDIDKYGGTSESSGEVVDQLSSIRSTFMELNKQLDIADIMIKQVNDLSKRQGKRVSISENYLVVPKG